MLKAIIFDYDGVIVDSFPTIHEIYQSICRELGLQCPSDINEFRTVYGYNSKEAKRNLGITNSEQAEIIFNKKVLEKKPKLYPGTKEVLEKLKEQYKLFLITANLHEEAEQKLINYSIRNCFSEVLGRSKGGPARKVEQIEMIVNKYDLDSEEIIYVGDRDVDVDIASKARIKKVILTEYGWGFSKEKHPHITSIKTPLELPEKVRLFS